MTDLIAETLTNSDDYTLLACTFALYFVLYVCSNSNELYFNRFRLMCVCLCVVIYYNIITTTTTNTTIATVTYTVCY